MSKSNRRYYLGIHHLFLVSSIFIMLISKMRIRRDYSDGVFCAIGLEDGNVLGIRGQTNSTFGAWLGIVFACNGDPILAGKTEEIQIYN